MKQSKLFTKTAKEAPRDEVSKNAQLLIRAGFIHKEMAGVYSYLPLGLRVLNKIVEIIRSEMNKVEGQELSLTALQSKAIWEKTDRWDDKKVDNWFKTQLKNGSELGLGFTHEEALTNLMVNHINSYKDLPCYPYQFQTKFRNELRAKSGIMRGREFLMKDMYSFSADEESHDAFYEQMKIAYMNIFNAVGIGGSTYITHASGGTFCEFSHEFQAVSDAGEDIIFVDDAKGLAINDEVMSDDVVKKLGLEEDSLVQKKSIEVGNIFSLGTKFSEPLGLTFVDAQGKTKPVIMGSYGIGPGRLMGTVVELLSDEKGIVWPESIAPYQVHVVSLGDSEEVKSYADKLYETLLREGVEVLYDDRPIRAGEKFADADLIGIPQRVIVSEKSIAAGGCEVSRRHSNEGSVYSSDQVVALAKR